MRDQKVLFTEYPLWIAFSLALLINISGTVSGFPLRNSLILKHAPLLIFLPAFALYIVARTIMRAPRLDSNGWYSWLWPFLLLGIFATLGSLYARIALHVRETCLTLGIYTLLTPLFFVWAREIGNTNKIIKPFVLLWGLSSCIAVVGSVVYFGRNPVLHNIEFLVQPFFLYAFFSQTKTIGKVFALLLIAAVAILTQKLTGYITGIAAISYIAMVYTHTIASQKWGTAIRAFSVASVIGIVVLSVVGFFHFRDYLPSGNMEVRLQVYEIALAAFLDSPLWGRAYTASSGEVYIEYMRSLNIPTHSDILDLLKQGGVIALGLWLIGTYLSLRLFVRCAMKNSRTGAFFHAMAFLTISTALGCAVNPQLLIPTHAYFIWGSLALGLGVATDTRKGQFNEC